MNISAINNTIPKAVHFTGATEVVAEAAKNLNKNTNVSKISQGIAKGFGKVADKGGNLFDKLSKSGVSASDLTLYLNSASSAVTTGLYVYKSLTDKKKSKNEKLTQALNQVLTFGISQALTYTVMGALKNVNKGVCQKFEEVIKKVPEKAKNVKMYTEGAKAAVGLVVSSSISRLIVPVGVTPIANKIGEKLCKFLDKRDAEKAAAKTAQEQTLNKQA